jgi:hypothetical protein
VGAAVAGEVAVLPVDHSQVGAHVAGKIEAPARRADVAKDEPAVQPKILVPGPGRPGTREVELSRLGRDSQSGHVSHCLRWAGWSTGGSVSGLGMGRCGEVGSS